MELADLAAQMRRLAPRRQSRRSLLGRLGAGGLGVGLLTGAGARSARAQDWEAPVPGDADASAPMGVTAPLEGISGGLPPFAYPLETSEPHDFPAGAIRWATAQQMPPLRGVSMASVRIAMGGLRELHWHLNVHELSYCLSGAGQIGIFAPDGSSETIDIAPGSITFVPEGYTHYIENTGVEELHLVIAFTDEHPETTDFSQALPVVPTPLLAQTFGVTASEFPFLATTGDRGIVPLTAPPDDSDPASPAATAPSTYSTTADQLPVTTLAGGMVQPLTDQDIPSLQGITVFPLTAVPRGLREPHWHTNAGELNYCVSGRAQISLVAPDGNVQTFIVNAGDIAFIPRNWFHYIANISDEPLQFLIFFITEDSRVQTINLSRTVDTVPASHLAASFDVDPAWFSDLPKRGNVGIAPPVDGE